PISARVQEDKIAARRPNTTWRITDSANRSQRNGERSSGKYQAMRRPVTRNSNVDLTAQRRQPSCAGGETERQTPRPVVPLCLNPHPLTVAVVEAPPIILVQGERAVGTG